MIAVIAVPADAAQGVVNTVVAAGVKAVLNFSPGTLQVPPDVKLKSVDLTVSLESLSFFLAQGAAWSRRPKKHGRGRLSHVDARGRVRMVDVSSKAATAREAVARGRITMSRAALRAIRAGAVKKGDPLQTARLAGIMAAKRTAALIPLCHPLALSHVDVSLTPVRDGYRHREPGPHDRSRPASRWRR